MVKLSLVLMFLGLIAEANAQMKISSHEIYGIENFINEQKAKASIDYIDAVPLAVLWSKTFDSKFTSKELEEVKQFFQTPLGKK